METSSNSNSINLHRIPLSVFVFILQLPMSVMQHEICIKNLQKQCHQHKNLLCIFTEAQQQAQEFPIKFSMVLMIRFSLLLLSWSYTHAS